MGKATLGAMDRAVLQQRLSERGEAAMQAPLRTNHRKRSRKQCPSIASRVSAATDTAEATSPAVSVGLTPKRPTTTWGHIRGHDDSHREGRERRAALHRRVVQDVLEVERQEHARPWSRTTNGSSPGALVAFPPNCDS